jgi:tetratricopeptide (TPR) repeat protein
MNLPRFILVSTLALLLSVSAGCSKHQPADLNEALALYRENKLEQALPLFEQLVTQDKNNPENYVWLAETYRRLGKKEEALNTARRALELDPRNSFAHMVIAEAVNPVVGKWAQADSDSTWFHVMKAVECDSTDGNPWLLVWGEAIQRGKPALMRDALRKLVETGFLTKAALAYGRWMLRALPEKAILLTNGDMDTYPPCAVQEVEGLRRDVVVVNRGTLNEDWYARFIRDNYGVPLPLDDAHLVRLDSHKDDQGNLVTPSDQIFRGWLEQKANGSLNRPLAVAVTVDESYWSSAKNNMRFAGAFFHWCDAATAQTPDTASMHASVEGLSPYDFAGPWVSDQDRSPIRRMYTKNIVRNVTETAILYCESLLKAGQLPAANRWTNWADELDKKAELGPVFTERIAQLKERIGKIGR